MPQQEFARFLERGHFGPTGKLFPFSIIIKGARNVDRVSLRRRS
jgi:hypothetical protein